MNQSLMDQLKAIGANTDQFASSAAIAQSDRVQVIDRSDLSVVRFSGSDVSTFLQSQTCNDHALLNESTAQLDGYCSPKGRLLALPMVIHDSVSGAVYWLLPSEITDSVVTRIKMFVMRNKDTGKLADVTIEIEPDWSVMGLAAFEAQLNASPGVDLTPWLGAADADAMSSWGANNHLVCKARSADGIVRTLLIGSADDVAASIVSLNEAVSSQLQWASAASWTLGDIQAGVPSIMSETQDAFVPQMVNMEQVQGLSFTKGCYPGQEIVARMQYLGKLKRTMMRFNGPANGDGVTHPVPGDALSCGDDSSAGQVLAATSVGDTIELLAVVKTSADPSAFTFKDTSLTVQELPYAYASDD